MITLDRTAGRAAVAAILAAAAVAGAASASNARASALYYEYWYYSDASKTTLVGNIREQCSNGFIVMPYAPEVVFTEHYNRQAIGNCPGLGDW